MCVTFHPYAGLPLRKHFEMKKITQAVAANMQFSIGFILILFIASLFLFVNKDKEAFLILNSYHSPGLDIFFTFYTHFGNGFFSVILGIIFLLTKRVLLAQKVIAAYLLSGIFVQIIKHLVYAPRPKMIFDPSVYSNFIDGVTLANASGFPSGHTASAFALAAILAIHTKNKKISFLYLVAAILAGFSRIYLGQHFLSDVIAGSLIGVISAFVIHSFMQNSNFNTPLSKLLQRVKL